MLTFLGDSKSQRASKPTVLNWDDKATAPCDGLP